ncbi:lysophospholipid acyltransferase family protein [Bacillus sp. 31A1R]|uniref:Lysophospholipid acyltransferase family protein n=1 Tax=Robertmurraya mangrovi TaxID=3098077 RepID=A0ABU5J351_9BACI|nr:lysophospholipid acyltransferase family protein [Bacillus sp. 31A1R]MDZ5473824.1 lysophospholipid acyltransferase family protein [Bacillus sp. 31A1R]
MIYPKKSKMFERVFYYYLNYSFRKHFYKVHVDVSKLHIPEGPVLVLLNHSNWWDGLVSFYLNQTVFKKDSYAVMSKKGIEDYPFFRKIGAFSVDPNSPKSLMKSLQFAKELLDDNKYVWMFPQGKEEHLEKRPLEFMKGPAYLIEKSKSISIVMIALYYTYTHHQKPEIFIKMVNMKHRPMDHLSRKEVTSLLENELTSLVDVLKEDILNERTYQFQVMTKGTRTVNEWVDQLTDKKKEA